MKCRAEITGILFTTLFFFSSCEKNISLKLHPGVPALVVEGTIETGRPPVVVLTHSLNYFAKIDSSLLEGSYVHGAKVRVSDGTDTVMLREYSRDTTNGNILYFYTIDSSGLQKAILGRRGGRYTLSIEAEGAAYRGVTTIPAMGMWLDSLGYLPAGTKKPQDSDKVILVAQITDPPEKGDAVRYFTRRNSEPFYPGYNSVADDEVVNGTTFDFDMDRGVDKNRKLDFNDYGFFTRGDTVTVKFCDIDRATYDFWRTWEYAFSNNGNPFSSAVKILGNIPGALGYWGGYATQYKRIIIPK